MTTFPGQALVDTNVLVYAVLPAVPQHAASRALVDRAQAAGANLCVAPQNLVGFYAVVTDPRRVTQPRGSDEALRAVEDFLSLPGLTLLPVPNDLIARWAQLVRQSGATRRRAFDTQLVATMLGNAVTTIYTFNTPDFQQFGQIQVLTP